MFIEDIIALCKRMNPRMPESEKVKHIMIGIKEEAFQLLMLRSPSTLNEVMSTCKNLQDAHISRIRLPQASQVLEAADSSCLMESLLRCSKP